MKLKRLKQPLLLALTFLLLFQCLRISPISLVGATETKDTTPVWTIAWVYVPEFTVEGEKTYLPSMPEHDKPAFFAAADWFEKYIEHTTEGAVDIQITKIDSAYPGYADHNSAAFVYHGNYADAYAAYSLNDYDSTMFGIPPITSTSVRGTANFRTATVQLNFVGTWWPHLYDADITEYNRMINILLHEFMHNLESWFRHVGWHLPIAFDRNADGTYFHRFYPEQPMPEYAVPYLTPNLVPRDGYTGPLVPKAGYPGPYLAPTDNIFFFKDYGSRQGAVMDYYKDFLTHQLPDPLYGIEPGHTLKTLGVSSEMWQYTPTNGKKPPHLTETPVITPSPAPTVSPTPSPGTSTPSPTPSPATTDDCCIDYSPSADIIVSSNGTPKINLSTETLDLAGFAASEFSVDGGGKWKAVKSDTFGDKKFAKLLNKGMTLHLKDAGGSTVTFPAVNPRPKPKLAINYEIAASGGDFGQWVLTEKKGTTAVKNNIQIGIAGLNDKGKPGKTVDTNGWGKFYTDGGICVKPIGEKKGKPAVVKTVYFYRAAPNNDGGFTPGSAQKKVSVTSQLKPVKYKVGTNKAKADKTYVNGTAHAKKAEFTLNAGDQVWHGATAKKAASAKQILPLPTP
ncbi:MAG: hypothetical protein FWH04_09550 [Oscillospiraceae bacterium]|nr:hypothetical protein [Oscillospiraceae bacterium]